MDKFKDFLSSSGFAENSALNAKLERVTISKNKRLTMHISLDYLKDISEVIKFVKEVKAYFSSAFNDFDVTVRYLNDSEIDYVYVFKSVIEEVSSQFPRYKVFEDFVVKYDGNYTVLVDKDSAYLSIYQEKLKGFFTNYGINKEISIIVSNDVPTTEELMRKVDEKLAKEREEIIKVTQNVVTEEVVVKKDRYYKKIDTEPVSISEIPIDQYAIDEYVNKKGPLNFVVVGEVFTSEVKKLSNWTLLEMKITDHSDSIVVKRFLRKPEEIKEMSNIRVGDCFKVSGKATYDTYARDVVLMADVIQKVNKPKEKKRVDNAANKRVELHTHTIMSNMDAVTTVEDYVDQAINFGHKAIAFTDHSGVYSIPDIYHATHGKDIKPIYGVEMNFLDENDFRIAFTNHDIELEDATYVVFDIESTGFSTDFDEIVEIAACKVKHGEIIEEFESLIKPTREMGKGALHVTGITDDMLKDAENIKTVLPKFCEFAKGAILVAHNAKFDMGHIYENYRKIGIEENYPVLDTMQIAQAFYNQQLKRFNLKALAKLFKVKNEQAHRAIHDTRATAEIFIRMLDDLKKLGIENYKDINSYIPDDVKWKYQFPNHITLLVKTQEGYKNLFKIVSDSLTTHFFREGRLLKSVLDKYRDGILVGSACVNGEVFETAMNKPYSELVEIMKKYDYIEVQPPCAYSHLAEDLSIEFNQGIIMIINKIIKAAKEVNKPVVATGDVHYLNSEDKKYRDIYIRTKVVGGGLHPLANYKSSPQLSYLTTEEMFAQFSFLDIETAKEIIVKNTNDIADSINNIIAFKKELYSPKDDAFKELGVESIEKDLESMVLCNAKKRYGDSLPRLVSDRLDKELNSIIKNKFSPIYYMAHLLVKKSMEDGYLVGSRGSVGSSLVATMMNITEVNPLSPHYRCPKCCFSTFKMNEEEIQKYGFREEDKNFQDVLNKVESGFDLPDANCPLCGEMMIKDGHDIPFETFLGFEGDKVPDIDLNFSGDYQSKAHLYVRELMGEENAFRAGTTATVAEKTAFGYVKGYFEDQGIMVRKAEIERLAKKIEGVKRSTGQHPGGIVVVPKYVDIYDVTPIQYPADDTSSEWRTTHFDYHSFEANLLKLDILGHDDPTVIKYIMDYVKLHQDQFPFSNPQDIPIDDPNLYQLFCGTSIINVSPSDIDSDVASYAVPELGTNFVRQMLSDTKPRTFGELVKISGLSHGTDVWLNNAQSLVLGKTEYGNVSFKDVIGCRDDIMVYLMYQGLEPALAFEIMEFVRKGKPSKDHDKWEKHKNSMREKKVPEWYIWSCEQIKYMFPKAHATAYVMMAMRIAWFKVYRPILFYSAYFSKRAVQFDPLVMSIGSTAIRNKIHELNDIISGKVKTVDGKAESIKKAEDLLIVLYVALEMTQRGLSFKMVDIEKSEATTFVIEGNSLILPFITIEGLGENVAYNLVEERSKAPFSTKADVSKRSKVNKTVFEKMINLGVLNSLSDNIIVDEAPNDLFAL